MVGICSENAKPLNFVLTIQNKTKTAALALVTREHKNIPLLIVTAEVCRAISPQGKSLSFSSYCRFQDQRPTRKIASSVCFGVEEWCWRGEVSEQWLTT